jgi:alcohol dehydrogenase (NADP+)
LGAHEVVISKDEDAMNAHAKSCDFIIDTVSAKHPIDSYLNLLKRDGTLCLVGASPDPIPFDAFSVIRWRRALAGSLIGGIAETQEMLDFCAERGISCDIEKIDIDYINDAYERMMRSDVKYRFVIDIASLK